MISLENKNVKIQLGEDEYTAPANTNIDKNMKSNEIAKNNDTSKNMPTNIFESTAPLIK